MQLCVCFFIIMLDLLEFPTQYGKSQLLLEVCFGGSQHLWSKRYSQEIPLQFPPKAILVLKIDTTEQLQESQC